LSLRLILLPGMLCDQDYYEAQLPRLCSIAEVSIAAYPTLTTIADMAQRVLQDAPERFALAGHSMGGRVAQEIVARAPARVAGLGLFGTDYRGLSTAAERAAEEAQRQQWLELVDREGFAHFAEHWARLLIAPARQADRALIASIVRMAQRFGRAGLDAHCRAGLSRPDYASLLPRIEIPCLLIAGGEDRLRTPEVHREMARLIPKAQLAVLEGVGHMLSMEAPEAVSAHMLPWLASLRP